MKFKVEVVFTNFDTFDRKLEELEKDDRIDAEVARYELADNPPAGYSTTYSKVFPIVECSCGNEVICTSFTNTCTCGCDYNFAGDLLAERSCWGEETGENWSECY